MPVDPEALARARTRSPTARSEDGRSDLDATPSITPGKIEAWDEPAPSARCAMRGCDAWTTYTADVDGVAVPTTHCPAHAHLQARMDFALGPDDPRAAERRFAPAWSRAHRMADVKQALRARRDLLPAREHAGERPPLWERDGRRAFFAVPAAVAHEIAPSSPARPGRQLGDPTGF